MGRGGYGNMDENRGKIDCGPSRKETSKQPAAGPVNPSGPTTGTEGWGHAPDEANVPGANPTAQRPGKEGGGNLRNSETRNEGSHTFRCSDAGNSDCRWEVSGRSAEELMPQIERHGREAHGNQRWERTHILNSIRERKAA